MLPCYLDPCVYLVATSAFLGFFSTGADQQLGMMRASIQV